MIEYVAWVGKQENVQTFSWQTSQKGKAHMSE
jgi:hypothetical protein